LPQVVQRILILLMRELPCYSKAITKDCLYKELTLPVICRNALTIVALVNDFVNPSFLEVIERAKAHFCPGVFNCDYLKVALLLSMLLSKMGLLLRLSGLLLWDNIQHFIIARDLLKGYVKIGAWD
jgi:hypothetical protein